MADQPLSREVGTRTQKVRGLQRLIFRGDHGGVGAERAAVCHPLTEPIETDQNQFELVARDDHQFASHCQLPTRRWVTPAERADAILEFSQNVGGRTGTVPWDELQKLHIEICGERDWDPMGWTAVGRELSDLLQEEKKTYENGKRVYRIPPLVCRSRLKAV